MNKEAKNLVKKTAKIAGATCIAAGAVALVTTGAALKALGAGAKYLKDAVQKILADTPEAEIIFDTESTQEANPAEAAEIPATEITMDM